MVQQIPNSSSATHRTLVTRGKKMKLKLFLRKHLQQFLTFNILSVFTFHLLELFIKIYSINTALILVKKGKEKTIIVSLKDKNTEGNKFIDVY